MTASTNALSNPAFRLFTAGSVCFFCGWWLQRVTLAWAVWSNSSSAFWLALLGLAEILPLLVLNPISGALADRVNRLDILKWSQVFAAAVSVILMISSLFFDLSPNFALLMFSLRGAINALYLPAALAIVPSLIDKRQLNSAIGINSVVINASITIGPSLAGFILLYSNAYVAYALSALLHVIFFCLLFAIPREATHPPRINVFSQMFAGHSYAFKHAGIRTMLLMFLVATLGGRSLIDLLPAFAGLTPQTGLQLLSFFFGAFGLGATAGSIWMSIVGADKGKSIRAYVSAALFVMIIAAALFSGVANFLVSIPAAFVLGFTIAINGIGTQTIIQYEVADAFRGRVMALYAFIFRAGWAPPPCSA
jgi:predicted MFS family arabinose efflux permease